MCKVSSIIDSGPRSCLPLLSIFVPVSSTAQRRFSNVDTSQRLLSQLLFEPIPAVWRYVLLFNFVSFQNNLLTTPPSLEPVSRILRFLWTNVRFSHKPRKNKRTFRSLLFHVNGPGTRCSLFSRIFFNFSRNDVTGQCLRVAEGQSSPQSPPAGAFLLKKKKKLLQNLKNNYF